MDFTRIKRTKQAFWIFIFVFSLLTLRLYFIQLKIGPDLAEKAYVQQRQIIGLEEVPRGDIYDRNNKPLTGNEQLPRVVVFPYLIKEKVQTAEAVAWVLGTTTEDVLNRIKSRPLVLEERISEKQAKEIVKLQLSGVQVHYFKQRYDTYPLAVHLIGHLGKISASELDRFTNNSQDKVYRPTDLVGKMGLERYYDVYLKGTGNQQFLSVMTDAKNRPVKGMGIKYNTKTDENRKNLILTLDRDMQKTVEEILDKNQVTNGAVVVMDIATGDILSMSSRPTFDPDSIASLLAKEVNGNVFLDNCLQLVQPGSVFKPVVAAAALEMGIVSPDSRFLCLGAEAEPVRCYRDEGHGLINFAEAMVQSCNPVFAKVGSKVGPDKVIDYATRLGLADQTIIGYPYPPDKRQDLSNLLEPYSIVNTSVGQGPVLVNPVQITTMMATFARDGIYKRPRLVKEIVDQSFNAEQVFKGDYGKRVVNSDTCAIIRSMFQGVTQFGTGTSAYVPGWGSAGKTGSAQVNKSQGIVDAWFTGYAPIDNPQYAVTVLIKGGVSGGKSAAPIFKEIMETILHEK